MSAHAAGYAVWLCVQGGLATDFYNGNAFWDGVTFITPSLALFHPQLARASLQYRFARMPEAEAYAAKHNWSGAYWPWQTAATGEEVDIFPSANILEQHIVSEVALLGEQYWAWTGDSTWVHQQGVPMASAAAEFWMSRLTPTGDGTSALSLRNTVPADEFAWGNLSLTPFFPYTGVDDAVFTNGGAQRTLQWAARAAAIDGGNATKARLWAAVAARIRLLFNASNQVHPEYVGFPAGNWDSDYKVKQADVVLLPWPLGLNISAAVRLSDLDYYEPMYFAQGPDMTWATTTIGYLSVVDRGVAGVSSTSLRSKAAAGFARARLNQQPPFDVWTETPNPNKHAGDLGAYNFCTGASTWALALTSGYAGMRLHSAEGSHGEGNHTGVAAALSFAPQLPSALNVSLLRVRGVAYRNWTFDITCEEATAQEEAVVPAGGSGGVGCSVLPTAADAGAPAMYLRVDHDVRDIPGSGFTDCGAGPPAGQSEADARLQVGVVQRIPPRVGAASGVGPWFRLLPST